MQKRFSFFLLLVLPFCSGCSWLAEMMLFNQSQHPAVVKFRLQESAPDKEEYVAKAYRIEKWNDSIPVLGDTMKVYSHVNTDGTIYVELPSNSALVLTQGVNDDMRDRSKRKELLARVKSLNVVYPNDATFSCHDTTCVTATVVLSMTRAGIVVR